MTAFISNTLELICAEEILQLHCEHAVYWPAQKTLLVADVHVGKEHRFGRGGVPIPGGISEQTLDNLFTLCQLSGAERIIVLGDFMHSIPTVNESWLEHLSTLLNENTQLCFDIVAGNHDKPEGREMVDSRIHWHDSSLQAFPFVFKHEPEKDPSGYVLSGHLHPAWRISRSRRSGLKAPAFWFREHYAVLPAYGPFTGGMIVKPDRKKDSIYMAGSEAVINIPLKWSSNSRRRFPTNN